MGDFMKGVDKEALPEQTLRGIETHRMIDRYTDSHHLVRSLKPLLSERRRRFSGLISDVVFDHFLAKHWQQFHPQTLPHFCQQTYRNIQAYPEPLPGRMPRVVESMIRDNWLAAYADLVITGQAIDSMSKRIRFKNQLAGAIDEVITHYDVYERHFLEFFPYLRRHVERHGNE